MEFQTIAFEDPLLKFFQYRELTTLKESSFQNTILEMRAEENIHVKLSSPRSIVSSLTCRDSLGAAGICGPSYILLLITALSHAFRYFSASVFPLCVLTLRGSEGTLN